MLPLRSPFYSPRCGSRSPHDQVIWTDGSVYLSFGKGGFGVLASCSLCGTEATLCFSAGPVCSSFPLKPTPFCTLFAGLGSTNNPPFLFSPTLALSSFPSFLLPQSLWQELSFLFSFSIRLQWVPGHLFFPRNDFFLFFNKRVFCRPTSFPISELANSK